MRRADQALGLYLVLTRSANCTRQVPHRERRNSPPAAADSRVHPLARGRGSRSFPGGLRFGQGNAAATAGPGLVAIPQTVPGRGRERQPPRVAPEVLAAAGLGFIGPVIWSTREAV
jgi:hypothetical protein